MCKDNYVIIADPIANFSLPESFASCPPLIAEFNNTSVNSNHWEWDFGDNSGTAVLENPPHVYSQPGNYTVSLIAGSVMGCSDTLVLVDLIHLDGPEGSFEYEVDSSCVPVKITLKGNSDDFYEYVWDMGNGDLITRPGRLNQDTFVYYYQEPGIYTPKLRLIDSSSDCEVVIEPDSEVFVTDLNLEFTALDTTLCGDEFETQFINLSSSNIPIDFLEWTFEGSTQTVSTELEPRVVYTDGGAYDVQLIAGNEFCKDTLIKSGFIRLGEIPNANITATPDNGCEPFPVQFRDSSIVEGGVIISWLWDFGDEATSIQSYPMHTYTDGGEYAVKLTVTSNMGCTAESTTTIPVQDAMEVSIAAVDPICIGEKIPLEVSISDTSNISVSWDNGNSLSCVDCAEPNASPEDTTTFTITVSNDIGCQNTASVTVDVRPFRVPEVTLSADTTICPTDIINLYVGGEGADVFAYDWDTSVPGLSCYENCTNPIASPDESTTYFVQVTSPEGCTSVDSVAVNVVESLQALASDDKTICIGDTLQLNTEFGENPQWLNPTRLDCAYCPSPNAAPKESITYRVEVTDEFGCRIQDTVRVEVVQMEDVDAGDNQNLCLGDEVLLTGKGVGQVRWSPSIGISNAGGLSPRLSPNISTTYFMTVTNGECIMTDSVRIEVIEKTELELENVRICLGESISLSANGDADTYVWTLAEEEVDNNSSTLTVSPDQTTTYSVIGQLSTCDADTAYATVEVIPLPNVYLPPSRGFFKDQTFPVGLQVNELGNYNYQWFPGDGLSCDDCPDPDVSPETDKNYRVVVTEPSTGCVYDQTINLKLISECDGEIIAMPNVFSPNNDGNNDELKMSTALVTEIKRYQIFDRWGGLVFETKDLAEGWDGTLNGQRLQQGVYLYFIEARCDLDGTTFLKKGDVTLVK